jgi:hypothetical protein
MPEFIEDLQAAVDALGDLEPGMLLGVALTPWDSAEQRDAFLSELTKKG